MKSLLWTTGMLVAAALLYGVDANANCGRTAAADMGASRSDFHSGYIEEQPVSDAGSAPSAEGTGQKEEIETGTTPTGDPGQGEVRPDKDVEPGKDVQPGTEAQPGAPTEGGEQQYRPGVDTGK